MKLVTLQQASALTKLSEADLKSRVQAGSLPAFTAKSGKILFDVDRLMIALKVSDQGNLSTEWEAEPIIDFAPYNKPKDSEVTMANVDSLFCRVSQTEVTSGLFAPDTFMLRPTDEPTSETLTIEKAPQKP